MSIFSLTVEQRRKLQEWKAAQDAKVVEMQKDEDHPFGNDKPYYGAIGGELNYSFTPTTIGLIVTVTNTLTNETIDLTEYDSW